jgi:RecA-family ATPase
MSAKNKGNKKQKQHRLIEWNAIQPKPIKWLWDGIIPLGKITILSGDAGLGKTSMLLDIAARLTTGSPMPFSDAEPLLGNVLFQCQEDELDDTLVPRCIKAGVDINRIASIGADDLNIDEDCDIIEGYIKQKKAKLLVIDPLQSWAGTADLCRINDVRRILTKLGAVAARNECAVVIIVHQSKSTGGNDLHRVFGSVDITATARSVLRVSKSKQDSNTRIVSHIKSNISRTAEQIAFRIQNDAPILYLSEYNYDDECDFITDTAFEDSSKRTKAASIIYSMLQDGAKEGDRRFRGLSFGRNKHKYS